MINAPPMPIATRATMRWLTSVAKRRAERRDGEDDEPDLERPRATEPVAERAHRQEQAGEDEDVGVDHPLELGRRRREGPLDRRQGDVEDGVVEPDEDEAQRQDAEGPPAPRVHAVVA